MFRTVEAEACEGAAGDAEREAGGVRLVGHQPVDPERDDAVYQDHPGEQRCVHEHAGLRRRVAGAAEVGPPREQRDDRDAGDDRAVVEAPHDVEDEQRSEQRDCDLPAAAAAAGEAPGGDDERRRERGDEAFVRPCTCVASNAVTSERRCSGKIASSAASRPTPATSHASITPDRGSSERRGLAR